MPVLSLSAVVTVSSNADGSRLKCMIGSKVAAKAESITKLCSSDVLGSGLWCDFRNAKCGHSRPHTAIHAHDGQLACSSCKTSAAGRIPSPMPSVRKR
jgi:hypothetical protein